MSLTMSPLLDGYASLVQPCYHDDFRDGRPTFTQRYYSNGSSWRPGGPVLFYAGNEGPLETFVEATGFMRTLAAQLGGLVVFGEHRGYGKSTTRSCADGLRSVSSTAALADFAALAALLRRGAAANATLVAVGGSYGGMLAAWLRLRYAHLFDGALASSAPLALGDESPPTAIYDVVGADYACAAGLGAAFRALWAAAGSARGRAALSSELALCSPPASAAEAEVLVGVLQQAFFTLAQLDYPYAAAFGGVALPASPTSVACARFDNGTARSPIGRLGAAAAVAAGALRRRGDARRDADAGVVAAQAHQRARDGAARRGEHDGGPARAPRADPGGERQAQGAEREPRRRAPAAHAAVARLDRAERAEQQLELSGGARVSVRARGGPRDAQGKCDVWESSCA